MRQVTPYLFNTSVFFAGCQLCRELQRTGVDAVTAAAALGALITYLPVPESKRIGTVRTIFCTGTFVGMSAPSILANVPNVALTSLIGAALFGALGSRLDGIGGRLGAIAFVTTVIFLSLRTFA